MAGLVSRVLAELEAPDVIRPYAGLTREQIVEFARDIRWLQLVLVVEGMAAYLDVDRQVLWVELFSAGGLSMMNGVPLAGRESLLPNRCEAEVGYHVTPHQGCVLR